MGIENYLNQTVSLLGKTSYDKYGKPVVGAGTNIIGRLQETTRRIVTGKQQEIGIDAELWVLPTQTLNIDDQISYNGVTYKVVKVDTKRGFYGSANHKKALLIKMP